MPSNQDLISKAETWFLLAQSLDWKSFDPYDVLLSPYLQGLQKLSPLAARICIQLGKRSEATLRRFAKVQPHEEAKTLSDYLEAAVLLSKGKQEWARAYLAELAQRLIARSIQTAHGTGWGLEFPYTTRFVNVAARTPNIYQTINTVNALLALYRLNPSSEYLDFALCGSRFIVEDLGVFEWRKLKWFRYWSGLDAPIVNIQASLAGTFSNLGILTGQQIYTELADLAMQTVVSFQNEAGCWYYSVDGKADFVDGFHTGFILQGLSEYALHCTEMNRSQVQRTIQKGFDFFKHHLLSASGMPLGFADGRVSLDGQNFAQCAQTFAICGQSSADIQSGLRIWREMIKIPSLNRSHDHQLRWTYGPAVLAAAHLLDTISRNKNASLN